jgi:hypothetical protein
VLSVAPFEDVEISNLTHLQHVGEFFAPHQTDVKVPAATLIIEAPNQSVVTSLKHKLPNATDESS